MSSKLAVAGRGKRCYYVPLSKVVSGQVGLESRSHSGVGEGPETVSFAFTGSLRKSRPRSAKYPAVVFAVHTASVSERIVKQ
ncbi:MAG: hypothetical protein JWO19_1238 [Bryobacterales bacterium]|jgi:hypothetical protein|nr:hypothetical protein [Bryobacterales bacterium]